MPKSPLTYTKPTLDKDLDKIARLELATLFLSRGYVGLGLAAIFLALALIFASFFVTGLPGSFIIIAAAVIGAYMALNIGANDVANNVGPAVGSKAMSMGLALVIAVIFESAGALIAGGDVVGTISKGIIDPSRFEDSNIFIWAMLAALISSAASGGWSGRCRLPGADKDADHLSGRQDSRRKALGAAPYCNHGRNLFGLSCPEGPQETGQD